MVAVDWLIPEVLCVKQGNYGGRARYVLKDTLKYLPLYGWYLGNVREGGREGGRDYEVVFSERWYICQKTKRKRSTYFNKVSPIMS